MKRLLLHPVSIDEIIQAKIFYNSRYEGLGDQLIEEMERAFDLKKNSPETWPIYNLNLHRYILKRFPFSIIYRIQEDSIEVIAFMHHHRRPYYWKKRLS